MKASPLWALIRITFAPAVLSSSAIRGAQRRYGAPALGNTLGDKDDEVSFMSQRSSNVGREGYIRGEGIQSDTHIQSFTALAPLALLLSVPVCFLAAVILWVRPLSQRAAMATSIKLFTGAEMPQIGLGTWKSEPGAVRAAVIAAIEAGYRHIDCAAAYGNEGEVGAGLADVIERGIVRREDLFITSKLWATKSHPDEVAGALAKTLSDLRTPYVDLYLVHWPFFLAKGTTFPPPDDARLGYSPAAFLAVWRKMEELVDSGLARHIGTSNMSARKLAALLPGEGARRPVGGVWPRPYHMHSPAAASSSAAAAATDARVPPAVNQVELHPFLPQQRLLDWCTARRIVLTAYSPLGSPDRPARLVSESDPVPLSDPTVARIAAEHGVSPGQVLLRWAVQRGTVAIPKSVTPARIAQNLQGVFSGWALSPGDLAALAELDRGGAGGRIVKGAPFARPRQAWEDLWDEDFDYTGTGSSA